MPLLHRVEFGRLELRVAEATLGCEDSTAKEMQMPDANIWFFHLFPVLVMVGIAFTNNMFNFQRADRRTDLEASRLRAGLSAELRALLEQNNFLHLKPGGRPTSPNPLQVPVATVGALIFNTRKEALMIRTHKWSNKWGIPGGKIKWGETSEAALRREILEETALKISGIEFILAQDCIRSTEFYKDAHFVLLNYTCRCLAKNPKVVLNEEGREYRWLTLAAAKKLKLNRPTKILIEAVIKKKKSRK